MRFDDRLTTVLDQPAEHPRDRAVRWRQLVDLVARAGGQSGNPLVARALELIVADRSAVGEPLRAAAARAIAALPLPVELVAVFASDRLAVSAPVLAAAELDAEQWRAVAAVADEETLSFIASLHPEVLAPAPAEPQPEPPREPEVPLPAPAAPAERRQGPGPSVDSRPALFRWEAGPSGDIVWVEGVPRGPMIGRSIARAEEGEGVTEEVERAFALRAPFRDAALVLSGEGPVAGQWKISGIPAFEPTDGRFAGYRGIALRESAEGAGAAMIGAEPLSDPNSLRELVHELKTPLNAIMGFAEIIDGEYLGPADRSYRTRAAEIVAQARLLLSAIDDLDFAAKLQADRGRGGAGTDLAQLLEQVAAGMRQGASGEAPRLVVRVDTSRRRCALEPALAERLVTRFCGALIGSAGDREQVELHLDSRQGQCLLWARRTAEPSLSLRLVAGLARIAGGDVATEDGRVTMSLPEL